MVRCIDGAINVCFTVRYFYRYMGRQIEDLLLNKYR